MGTWLKTRASVVKIPGVWRYRAQQHRTYWRARALGARALFSLRAGLFRAVTWFRRTGESAAIILGLGKLIAFSGITAVGLIALLAISERLILSQAGPVPEDISQWLHAIVSNTDFETLDSLLLTLLQVAGIFLGLYFTAVSVVASTVYARVQTDIRGLLTREKIGNFYLKLILLVGTMSLLILGASVAGHHPGVLASAVTVLLGILALLSFIPLGNRIFRFFDPTSLVELYVVTEIADWIRKASPEGFAWRDRSFQAHYHKEAESRLETYTNIVRFAITRDHLRTGSLVRLANSSCHLLKMYVQTKTKIPLNSLWFKQADRYKDWFRVSVTEADLAVRATATFMRESVPDPMWFEDHIFAINRLAMKTFMASRDYKSIVHLSENMRMAFSSQVKNFDPLGALHLTVPYQAMLLEHLAAVSDEPDAESSPGNQQFLLACADYYGLMLGTIAVELANALREAGDFRLAAIKEARCDAWWGEAPKGAAPAEFTEEFERIGAHLSLERAIEGARVSPRWYITQLLALSLVRSITAATEAVVERCVAAYVDQRETVTNRLSPVVAAQIVQRGFEVHTKAAVLLDAADRCLADLKTYRKVGDIPWQDAEVDAYRARLDVLRDCLLEMLCSLAPRLVELPRTGAVPDYFGEMYWRLAEECVEALSSAHTERFRKLLPFYFVIAHAALEKLHATKGLSVEYMTIYASDIVIDLMHISGLALLYSELRGGPEWSYCVELWNQRLAGAESAKDAIAGLVASVDYRSSVFMLSPRDLIRGKWEQALTHVLDAEGLVSDRYGPSRESRIRHRSRILRAFGRHGIGFVRPHHVFLAVYIRPRPEAAGLEFGMQVTDFERSLERESHEESEDAGTMAEPRPDPSSL